MVAPVNTVRKIEPDFLGPLTDTPLEAGAHSSGADELFPGASAFLGRRQQQRRLQHWSVARPLAERTLEADEHILYVAHAMQIPSTLQLLALGAMTMVYHQVVLIFTDRRIIEVLLSFRGKRADTRLRSFPWASVRDLKLSFSKLKLRPARGKKLAWKVPLRGDRKLLKPLLERVRPRLLSEGEGMAKPLPQWHCPQCGAAMSANPRSCDACHASFRSPRLAALLALAFPGAGLLYVGHPFLALADFLGEVFLYGIFLLLILEAGPAGFVPAVAFGGFFFLLTKLESMHLSRIFAARTVPEPEPRRRMFHRFALVGGLGSLMLVGGALPLVGAARPVIDRDLDIGDSVSLWEGSRNVAEWVAFGDDPDARSQWMHPSGLTVTVFAYPQGMLDSETQFRTDARMGLAGQGLTILAEDQDLPAPFSGFRFVVLGQTEEGEPLSMVHVFIVDREHRDIHQVFTAVIDEDAGTAEDLVRDFLTHADWIGAAE